MRCAVLGDPIVHSLSPTLHRAGYAAAGLDWEYDARRVAAGGLGDLLAGLDGSWRGLSLTMPLKREAMAVADEISGRAALAGAANTLVLSEGTVRADNTDLPGAVCAVREHYDGPISTATILGGGATAASVALALCDMGAARITVLARSAARATETLDAVAAHPSCPQVTLGTLDDDLVGGDVVVSTLPVEAQTPELVARCASVPVVFEVLYDPWPTPLAASAAGRILVSGLDLLVHQAVRQFELFTGMDAPLAEMRAAGEQALAARRAAG